MQRICFTTFTLVLVLAAILNAAAQTNFLEDEAGITAYTNVGRAINLSQVQTAFRTIEQQTDDYVIGSVAIPDYEETEDAHVYIQKDGWIAAYYLKDEPVAKMIDLAHYEGGQIPGTKLDLALLEVANALGLPLSDLSYYDFVAPQANQLLLVVDRIDQGQQEDSFQITIPNDITVFERSWSHRDAGANSTSNFLIDDNLLTESLYRAIAHGKLTPNQLSQGVSHTVTVRSRGESESGGIALVYQQP